MHLEIINPHSRDTIVVTLKASAPRSKLVSIAESIQAVHQKL